MKSALVYLTATKLKNQLVGVVKSPAKLIYGIFLIAIFALSAFSGNAADMGELRDPQELVAISTLFYTAMFLIVFSSGSTTKTPMFTLSDVTLLFPAPLNSNKILFYGLIRQLGLSLLLGFFLLFQYSWLHSLYGVTVLGMVALVVGYAVTLFFAQFTAMAVYTRTSGNEQMARTARYTIFGIAVLYGLLAVYTCRQPLLDVVGGGSPEPLFSAGAAFFGTVPGLFFPVSGWASGLIHSLLGGQYLQAGLFVLLLVVLFGILLWLILTCKNNYYEDVLETAETAQSAITAQKEGQLNEVVPKNVRVGKTGLNKGWGASAIYYKHRVENRRSGVFLFSNMSLLFAAIIVGMAFFMREMEMLGIFAFATYMQLFTVALGRFNRELIKPYIYLIPEPPLKKLLYAIKESIIADAWEALLIFVVVGLIMGAGPIEILLCVVARITFSLLFTSGNVLVERVFGMVTSKVLIFFFYFIVLLIMTVPGIVVGVILSFALPQLGQLAPALIGISLVNVVISVLVLWLCRNLLQYAELNNR